MRLSRFHLLIAFLASSIVIFLATLAIYSIFSISVYTATITFFGGCIGSLLTTTVMHIADHNTNSKLADELNCPSEDIYFARHVLGWHIDWIRENQPTFSYRLTEEKRKRGLL